MALVVLDAVDSPDIMQTMTKDQHGVAVVGCGALAQMMHLPHVVSNPRTKLVVACDLDRDTAEACRSRFGAERAETDWHQVVASRDVDLIILATHTNLRAELIVPALHAGKPVYTEKPLANSIEEMHTIVRASRETGVPVCVGHNRRSSPAMLEFRRLVEKALNGARPTAPTMDRSVNRAPIPEESRMQILIRINDDCRSWKDWIFHDPQGILYAEMVHFIDLALWLNPSKPVKVFAEGSRCGNFAIVLRFEDGSITTMHHSLSGHFDYPKELFECTVRHFSIAMEQHIEIRQCGFDDEPALKVFPYDSECSWAVQKGVAGYFREMEAERRRAKAVGGNPKWLNVNKGHYDHLDRFLDCIEGRGSNPCDAADSVPVIVVAHKLQAAIDEGCPLSIISDELEASL